MKVKWPFWLLVCCALFLPCLLLAEDARLIESRLQSYEQSGSSSEVLRLVFPEKLSIKVSASADSGKLLIETEQSELKIQKLPKSSAVFNDPVLNKLNFSNLVEITFKDPQQKYLWEQVGQTVLIAANQVVPVPQVAAVPVSPTPTPTVLPVPAPTLAAVPVKLEEPAREVPDVKTKETPAQAAAPAKVVAPAVAALAPPALSKDHVNLQEATEAPTATTVTASENLDQRALLAVTFDKTKNKQAILLKLSAEGDYTLEKRAPGIFILRLPDCTLREKSMELPFMAPADFKGLKYLIAKVENGSVLLELRVQPKSGIKVARDKQGMRLVIS